MFETMDGFECDKLKWKRTVIDEYITIALIISLLSTLHPFLLFYSSLFTFYSSFSFFSFLFFSFLFFSSLTSSLFLLFLSFFLFLPFFFSSSFLLLCFCSAYFIHISDHSFLSSCTRIGLNILFIISRNKNNCRITLNKINMNINLNN